MFKIEKTATVLPDSDRARYRELSDAMAERIITRAEETEFKSLWYRMNGWTPGYAKRLANRAYAISKANARGAAKSDDIDTYWYITDALMTNDFGIIYGAIKLMPR